MAVGAIRRGRPTITVHVRNEKRHFNPQARSVAEHLSFLALREESQEETEGMLEAARKHPFPTAATARARQAELATLAVSLLQEPADGGPPLFEEDALDLHLGEIASLTPCP